MTSKEKLLHKYYVFRKNARDMKARLHYGISNEALINDLECLEWRKYVRAISFAYKKNIEVSDEVLTSAIIQIPEHYKITALRDYSQKVKPISNKYVLKIHSAINNIECVESYKEHLSKELEKFDVNENN